MLQNDLLTCVGALIGSSGAILSCELMRCCVELQACYRARPTCIADKPARVLTAQCHSCCYQRPPTHPLHLTHLLQTSCAWP